MTRNPNRNETSDLGARFVLTGSIVFALSAMASALFALYYEIGEAFPGAGVPIPTFTVVALAVVAILGLIAVGVGVSMNALRPSAEVLALLQEEKPETRQVA